MEIFLQLRSKVPIYEQISAQIKQKIIGGELKDGDNIPSMRALSKTLKVSVITVQKSYEDLQREGYIDSLIGRGTFVKTPNLEDVRKEYMTKIGECANEIIRLCKDGGISIDEAIGLIRTNFEEEDKS